MDQLRQKETTRYGKSYQSGRGFVVKRKARLEHVCDNCQCYIEPGEEYYQLTLELSFYGFITKHICEQRRRGKPLEA